MLKFNSDNLIVGEIKELLASFNLPKYRIYTNDNEAIPTIPHKISNVVGSVLHYTTEYGTSTKDDIVYDTYANTHMNYVDYIKDGTIQRFVQPDMTKAGKWLNSGKAYFYNQAIPNYTKNLVIKNAIYDSDTHEYLGDYLRFKRDYDGIDLMSMYNCFSNRVCQSLNISWSTTEDNPKYIFSTNDTAYKIYMVPVKLFKKYTIAIDAALGIEVCCGIYDNYYDSRDKLADLPKRTYKKFNKIKFKDPVIYDGVCNITKEDMTEMELAQMEEGLKLFIKVPINNKSSIVVLEGDYHNYTTNNHSIVNTEYTDKQESVLSRTFKNNAVIEKTIDYEKVKLYSPLQLLKYNTGENYAMSDRLFEYLCGNMITHEDTLPDNIRRVQKVTAKNTKDNNNYTAKPYFGTSDGLWDPALNIELYSYMFNDTKHIPNDIKYDITGYVDKDIEKYFGINVKNTVRTTLTNVNLYADLYPITRPGKEE